MTKAYKSRWILTGISEALENHALLVKDGMIFDIVHESELHNHECKSVNDFGDAVITPGFVNLFVNPQYTDIGETKSISLKSLIKKSFLSFQNFILFLRQKPSNYLKNFAVLNREYFGWDKKEKIKSFKHGLKLCLLAGTTCISNSFKEQYYFDIINKFPAKSFCFFEITSNTAKNSKSAFRKLKNKIEYLKFKKSDNTFIGVAPMSVQTVHKRLWTSLSIYCRQNNLPVLTHFVESEEERDWFENPSRSMDLIYKMLNFKKLKPFEKGLLPVEYLKKLNILNEKLIIANANHLTIEELEDLAAQNVNFVYCPRSNDKIFNKKISFDDVLHHFGPRFGFGTANLYYNYDLSLINEVKYAGREAQIDALELLKHITIYPARILGLDKIIGSLEKNKDADFNVFKMNYNEDFSDLFKKQNPAYVFIKGKNIVNNGKIIGCAD